MHPSIRSLLIPALLFIFANSWGQTTYTWTGAVNSVWTNTGNWAGGVLPVSSNSNTVVFNNGGTYTITAVPSIALRQLLISGNSNITLQGASASLTISLSSTVAGTNFQITSGSTFGNSTTNPMNLSIGATSAQTSDISGTLNWYGGTLTFPTNAGSSATVASSGVLNHFAGTIAGAATFLNFASGSTYTYNSAAALTVPTATWDANSQVNITGVTTGVPLGLSQNFGNVTWDCPAQSTAIILTTFPSGIAGTFEFKNSNNQIVGNNLTTSRTWAGDLKITGGRFAVKYNFSATYTLTVRDFIYDNTGNANGQLILNSSVYVQNTTAYTTTLATTRDFLITNGANATNAAFINYRGGLTTQTEQIQVAGNFTQTGTGTGQITNTTASGTRNFIFQGGSNQIYSAARADIFGTLSVINITGATVDFGNSVLTYTGNFSLTNATAHARFGASGHLNNTGTFGTVAGSTLSIGSQDGITSTGGSGNIRSSSTRTYALTANYIYTGTTGQATGLGLAVGITGSISVNLSDGGALTLSNAGTFTIGASGRLRMINGTLANAASFNATGSILEYAGASAQTSNNNDFPATNGPVNLVINNASAGGVTLHAARSLPATGVLTLTDGTLNTTNTELLSITNTTVATAIVGGSAASYINGPLARNLASGTLTGSFFFPVGKTNFGGFAYNLSSTATGSTLTVKAEYFETAPSGGSAGAGMASIENRFWKIERTAGTGVLNNVHLTLTTSGIVSGSRLAYASTEGGSFTNIGGTGPAATITSEIFTSLNGTTPNGFYTLGTTGTLSGTLTAYTTLTSIADALRTLQLTGNTIFELPTSYAGEPGYPVVFNAFETDGTDWTATIQPASGSTAFLTAGDPGTGLPLINFDGIDRLTIDGRPGGSGTAIEWIFRNTRTAATVGPTFQLINDATYNTLNYLRVEGQNITDNTGTIFFSTAAGLALGNSNNTISNCHIRENTATGTTPRNGICSFGTAGIPNANNTITNNHIFNMFLATGSGSGIFIFTNNNAWTITNNHMYQTVSPRTGTTASVIRYGIFVNNSTGSSDNYLISGNYIGGSEANADGTAWTIAGAVNQSFHAIALNAANTSVNSVIENNIIRNFSCSHATTANALMFVGIYDVNGTATSNQRIEGNTIGSLDGTKLISINSPIATASNVYGIFLTHGADTILNNTIGGFSLNNAAGVVGFTGIHTAATLASPTVFIEGNTIGRVVSTYNAATAGGFVRGIYITGTTTAGVRIIRNNTIYSLSSATTNTGSGALAVSAGIVQLSTTAGHTISGNTIHSIRNTAASAATNIVGFFYNGAVSGTNTIEKNFIHSLSMATSSATASTTVSGMVINSGLVSVRNNMLRLGIDSAGNSVTGNYLIRAIQHVPTTTLSTYHFNTVFLGGTGVGAGSNNSFAFFRDAASGTLTLRNNIFYNARSNGTGTGSHYAIGIANMTGLSSNYNFFHAGGTGGNVGLEVATPRATLGAWQLASGAPDANSNSGTLNFMNATGSAVVANLHIDGASATPIESAGTSVGGNIGDYDGDIRFGETGYSGAGTAVDVGADEGEFTPVDLSPPNITYTAIPTQAGLSGPVLSATITDNSAVNTTSGTRPRIYYKRSTDANNFNDNTNATDGWKWVEASNTSSPFTFTINYALLNGGSVSGQETIQYFVVAQDQGANVPVPPNVGINSGTFNSTPSSVALASGNFPLTGTINSYLINVLSGTVTVGASGTYTSLTNNGGLFQAINTGALSGHLTAQITSDLTAETGTHALNQFAEIGAGNYRLTIRPDAATLRTISGGLAGALYRLDGADRVTIDGNFGGTGRFLLFTNTTAGATSATIQFLNEATNDTIRNAILRGSTTSGTLGVVVFGTSAAAGSLGNSNNIISNCDIHQHATALPVNGIYSAGTAAKVNSNNEIINNNIYNYFIANAASTGILVGANSSGWTISNNRFYQEASRAFATLASVHRAIWINNTSGNGFTINNNIIGYASNARTGMYTTTASVATTIVGIELSVGTTAATSVQGNTINAFSTTTTAATASGAGVWAGISITGGNVNVGTTTANTIGSLAAVDSVVVVPGSGGLLVGINSSSSGTVQISNNNIGSLSTNGAAAIAGAVTGIQTSAGTLTISGNAIGSGSTANSLRAGILGTSTAATIVNGINNTSAGTATISNNLIRNLLSAGNAAGGIARGIIQGAGSGTLTNNRIYNIRSIAASTGTGATAATIGILSNSATLSSVQSVTSNRIYSLHNSAASSTASVIGLCFSGVTTANHTLARNFIHSLSLNSSSSSAIISGINLLGGTSTIHNNMIRLGIDSSGAAITTGYLIYGIQAASSGANNYYFNTVYLGGTGVAGTANTFAFNRTAGTAATNIRNNIFYNARSNSAGSGTHYAIGFADMTGITTASTNFNFFHAAGTGGAVGLQVGTPRTTLADWRTAPGNPDLSSASGNLIFVNATGNASAADLHINTGFATQVESAGTAIAGTWGDFDLTVRFGEAGYAGAGTAVDIGAHEDDFSPLDLTAPTITFTALSPLCNSSSTASLSATITDASGVEGTAGIRPRVYYKRTTDANTFAGNTSGDNGWKWVESTSSTSPFAFSLNMNLLNGGSINPGDLIQYFVVAQDAGVFVPSPPNVGISGGGSFAATPSSVALSSAAFPVTGALNVFAILPCEGTVTVGTGGNYQSFTLSGNLSDGTAGIFQAINAAALTGNLTVNVISDINIENGAVALNQNAGVFNVRIQADGTTTRNISGSAATGLFRMDGADNVRFTGGSGANRYLRFTNTATNGATFLFINDAVTDTLNNLVIEGSSTSLTSGVILFSTSSVSTGNDNIRIENCDIKEAGSNLPANGIYALGTVGRTNDNIVITGCTISNYFLASSTSPHAGVLVSTYNNSWTIENNRFFQTAPRVFTANTQPHSAIYIGNPILLGSGFSVLGNIIGYSSASGTGTMTYSPNNTSTAPQFAGIYLNVLTSPVSVVSGNTIANISYTTNSAGTANQGTFTGIYVLQGAVNITGNTIGASTGTGSIAINLNTNNAGISNGIRNDGPGPVKIYNNNIGSITATGSGTNVGLSFNGIISSTGNVAVRGNNIGSLTTPNSIQVIGTVTSNANTLSGISIASPSTAYTDTISKNIISNLANLNTGTVVTVRGIIAQNISTAGSFFVDSNMVTKIYSASPNIGTTASSALVGILYTATGSPQTISRNKVSALVSTASTSSAISTIGIYNAGVASGTNTISRNLIHSFQTASSSTSSLHAGIYVAGGTTTYSNNMIRLGITPGGSNITTGLQINGIFEGGSTANNYYFNSIYIGGAGVTVSGGSTTYALNAGSISTGARNIQNNILWNARSNTTSGGGQHHAIRIHNTSLTSNNNVLLSNGTDGAIGVVNTTVYSSFDLWKNNTAEDASSVNYDPKFVNPTGDTTDIDLHISTIVGTPVESAGTPITGLSVDYDGDLRFNDVGYTGAGTSVDIGADENDFIYLDVIPPAIVYTDLSAICNTVNSQSLSAAITDETIVEVSAGIKPRIYFKKASDDNTYVGNTSLDNGWKWIESTSSSSPFSFTLDLTMLNGGGPVAGDAVQYFVVAQDAGPNVAIQSGIFNATPASVNLTSAAFPITGTIKSFAVLPCEGTVTVGSGGNYAGFTPNGGLFEAINATSALGGLSNNLVVNVISDVAVENGVNALNQWTGAYSVTIQPGDNSAVKTISNAANIASNNPMIPINGADRVKIDGSFSGSGRFLRFRNTNTTATATGAAIQFYNNAVGDTLANSILETNGTAATTGIVVIGAGTNTGILITGNSITSPSGGTVNNPANGIFSNVSTNTGITVSANEISNFNTSGILLGSSNGGSWTIGGTSAAQGNRFFQTASIAAAHNIINIGGSGSGHVIRFNLLGGNAAPVANVIQGTWTNTGGVTVNGILVGNSASATISNNTIQSFSLTSGTSIFNGISITSTGTNTVQTNLVGSASTANSILIAGTLLKGIVSSSTSASGIIGGASSGLGNTVANISATSSGQVFGIHTTAGANTIQNNIVHTLSTTIPSGTGAAASVIGISQNSATANQLVSTNTIYGLANTNSGSSTLGVTGIYYAGPTSGTNLIERNLIYGLSVASNGTAAIVTGISAAGGLLTVSNNMIRMGINTAGASLTGSNIHVGIEKASTNAMNFYFNSVYVGGTGVAAFGANTFAFRRLATGVDDVRNNIFVNNRSNSGLGGTHYAMSIDAHTTITSNFNIYQVTGTGGVLAITAGTNRASLQALKFGFVVGGVNQDLSSGFGDPNFADPAVATPDLHLNSPTPAEGVGVAIGSVSIDFDNDDRTDLANTPTDIGADAGNYTPVDIFAPVVSVSNVPSQAVCSGTLNLPITATVTDVGTGLATGSYAPTLWYRLSAGTGSPTAWAALAPTSSSGSTFNYDLSISGVVSGQTYQYYVAAQDLASPVNIGYSNFNATTPVHADVATTASTENTNPASFAIIAATPLSGVINVGTTETYTSLTGAGGLFAAINTNGLNGDLIVNIVTNTTETGANLLNQWAEYCGSNYSVLIQPDGTTVRVLSGAVSTSLVGLNGADRVTFEGNFDGAGQYLRFVNTNTSGNVFVLQNGTTYASIQNCIVEGQANITSATTRAIINIGGTASNNNIRIAGNKLGSSSYANNIIYSAGAAGDPNHTVTIENNEIFNFLTSGGGFTRAFGINITSTGNGSNWKIKNNSIYNTGINGQNTQCAINFTPGAASTNDTIIGNWIGGSSPQCGTGGSVTYWGNSWDNFSSGENQVQGIVVNSGTAVIDSNNISNIWVQNADYSGFVGIRILGSTAATITNNTLGTGTAGTPDNSKIIQVSGGGAGFSFYPGYIYGIWNSSTNTTATTYDRNNFYYLFQSGANEGGNVHCIYHTAPSAAIITNNIINGPQASGINWNSYGIRLEPTANTTGNIIEGNSIAGPYILNFGVSSGLTNNGIAVNVTSRTVSGRINRNVVWDMRNANGSGATVGILVWNGGSGGNGTWDVFNNQVTLMNNNLSTNRVSLYGIYDALSSASSTTFQYNSVLISGSNPFPEGGGFDASSYAFFRQVNSTGNGVGDDITLNNNIFINKRLHSNAASYGHFAIANFRLSGTEAKWNVSDYNFLQANSGSKCFIGQWGTATQTSLANWQSASSKDAASYTATYTTGASNFGSNTLNPDNLFATPLSDLHISIADAQSYQFVNNRATPISIGVDVDGDTRNATTPDIGADEFGTFNDAGIVSIKPACSGTAVEVIIRNYGSAVLNSVTVNWTVNGVSQTAGSFTGMGLASGATTVRTINLSSPASFTATTAYNVIGATASPNGAVDENTLNDGYTANPLYYGFGSTVYIGTGSPSFSTYSALFNAINNSVLTANLSVIVNANSTEPATPVFLNAVGYCGGDRTITVTPASATVFTATGNSGTAELPGMIGFNGAANITINGNSGGSGKYLRFRNTNTSRPVFAFRNDANTITVSNSVIEGTNANTYVSGGISNAPGIVFFGDAATGGNGNRNITLSNNTIRDRSDATGVPANAIFSFNNTASTTNNSIKILSNDIFNFSQTGVYLPDNAGNGSAWNISGNNFYCTSNMSSYQGTVPQHIAIYLKASTSHTDTIKHNFIGGNAAGATGTWTNSNNNVDFEGIRLEIGGTGTQTTLVDSNTIRNISLTGTGLTMFIGIRVKTGLVDIRGNTIGDLSATLASPNILVAGSGTPNFTNDNVSVFGIWNYSTSASTIANNIVAGIRSTAPFNTESGHAYLTGIRRGAREYGTNALNVYAGKSIIKGNTVANLFSETSLSNVNMNGKYVDKVWPAALTGIALRSNFGADNRVDSNTVYGLIANSTWNRWVRVNGIALNAESTADAGIVSKNRIYDLENYNGGVFGVNVYTPAISGIAIGASDLTGGNNYVANGSYTLVNNMIYLAPAVHPTKAYNNPDLYGILDVTRSGNTTRYFFNTIYISGAGKSSLPFDCPVVPSYGFMRSAAGNGESAGGTVHMKNNIIINNRTGFVDHFALCNNTSNPTTSGWSGTNINNNFFSTGNVNTVGQRIVGNFQTGVVTDFTFGGWQTAYSADANSKYGQTVTGVTPSSYTNNPSVDVVNPGAGYLFVDPDDITSSLSFLHIDETDLNSHLFVKENGTPVSGFEADFDEEVRSTTLPTIGADELNSCPAPTFVLQPANQEVCPGNTEFVVDVNSVSAETYQWQVSTNGGTTWNDLSNGGIYSGVDNDTLELTGVTSSQHNYQYRVKVENACEIDTSSHAVLTIKTSPEITVYNPGGFSNGICEGSNTSFGVTATGSNLTYVWQVSSNAGLTWNTVVNSAVYSGASTATLSIANTPDTLDARRYRVIVTGDCSPPDTSITGFLAVSTLPGITDQPDDEIACVGSTTLIEATAIANGTITYAWEYFNGTAWVPVSNGTPAGTTYSGQSTASLSVTTSSGTTPPGIYSYRMRYNTLCNFATPYTSNEADLTIQATGTWTGAISDDWNVSGNWCGVVPTNTVDVVIPASPESGRYPHVYNVAPAAANNLFLFTGSSVTIENGGELTLSANLTNNGQVDVLTGGLMTIQGNAGNQTGAGITIQAGAELELYGNLTNNGTSSLGAGLLQLLGTNAQQIGGTSDSEIGELIIANSFNGVALTLQSNMVVADELNMQNINGKLDLNGYDIDLGSAGVLSNETNSNRIFCNLGTGTITLSRNLAANTTYSDANLGGVGLTLITRPSGAAPGITELIRHHGSLDVYHTVAAVTRRSIARYFEIHPTVNTGLNVKMGIGYFEDELVTGSHTEADLIPWRLPDGGDPASETDWQGQFFPSRIEHDVATATLTNWVRLDSIPAFSTWTLSDWNTEPLPVELLSFTATANQDKMQVDLEWQTATEINNDYFTVQRSKNGVDFEDVFTKAGAGNSSTVKNYSGVDPSPYLGVSYYRLKQTDFNGSYSYSDVVPVVFSADQRGVYATSWINQDRNIQVMISERSRGTYTLRLFDASGKLVLNEQVNTGKGINHHLVYNPGLAPGIYLLRLEGIRQVYTDKLFIR
jgi:hypothetical protein